MLIWGDGRSNIAACDGLNSNNWDDDVLAKFTVGHGKEKKLRQFDIIVSNPPFAGDISSDDTLSQYELAFKIDLIIRTSMPLLSILTTSVTPLVLICLFSHIILTFIGQ